MYITIKNLHLVLVALSFIIFISRGILMLLKNNHYRHKIFRIIPPIIDSLLLASGVTLMVILQQYPTNQSWLAVKLSLLVAYILLGVIALNRVNHYKAQLVSFILAVMTILFMYSIARAHNPLGILTSII
ncbi:MAG: regulator SirB [Gammaproteobacteria bacterium]|nr:MAG: regulator SirB [Gammaproteobacteria bacterium]